MSAFLHSELCFKAEIVTFYEISFGIAFRIFKTYLFRQVFISILVKDGVTDVVRYVILQRNHFVKSVKSVKSVVLCGVSVKSVLISLISQNLLWNSTNQY